MSTTVEVEHRRVGNLSVPEEEIVEIAYVPGFPNAHRFVLLEHGENSPFLWMACLDDLDLAFAVTEPAFFFPDYDPKFSQDDLESIGVKHRDAAALLAIANVRGPVPALNLAAPLLLNRETREAIQIPLPDERYSTRQPLPLRTDEAKGDGQDEAAGSDAASDTPQDRDEET